MEAFPSSETRVRPRPAGSSVPLVAWQRQMWKACLQGRRFSDLRQCGASLRIRGPLDEKLLRRTIDMVVGRHESLRTRIVLAGGTPMQEIAPACDPPLEVIDLAGGSASEVWERATQFSDRFLHEQIDWSQDFPFSTTLLKLSKLDHVLLVGIDHTVTDGVSMGIVGRELASLYLKGERSLSEALPRPSLQFADYAVWQQMTLEAWRSKHEHYWRERLSRMPHVELPFDGSQPEQGCLRWITTEYALGAELSAKLRMLAWRQRMLLPLVVLGIVVAVLSRWADQPEWTVDLASHGRHAHPELADVAGVLATTLQLHFDVREDDSLLDLLKRIHLEYRTALEHQDYGRLPDCMPVPEAPVAFNWFDTSWPRAAVTPPAASPTQVEITPFPLLRTYGNLLEPYRPLCFNVDERTATGTVIGVGRQQDLVSPSSMERLGLSIRLFSEQFAANPLVMQRELRLVS